MSDEVELAGDAAPHLLLREQCLKHASDLVTSAQIVLGAGKTNIAFHLALLALEELGKLKIVEHARSRTARQLVLDSLLSKHATDHVSKIFWALWSHTFGRQVIDGIQIERHRTMARDLHEQRLAALYVNPAAVGTAPSDAVAFDFAKSTTELVAVLIDYEDKVGPVDEEFRNADLDWFLETASIETNFRLIFSSKAQQKLIEFGDMSQWLSWLRRQFEDADATMRALVDRERNRTVPVDGTKPKWRMTFTLQSPTHSIRPKALRDWNGWSRLVKLTPTGKRNSAIAVELTVYENIPLDGVAPKMLSVAKASTIALNIATLGVFWWYIPESEHPIYSRAHDLEISQPINLDFYQDFRAIADPRDRRIFDESDVWRLVLVFGHLPHFPQDFMLWYWSGLALLCKSDPLLQLNGAAVYHFGRAFRYVAMHFGSCATDEGFEDAAAAWIGTAFEGDARADMVALLRRANREDHNASYHDGLNMKVMLDLYICQSLHARITERAEAGTKEAPQATAS